MTTETMWMQSTDSCLIHPLSVCKQITKIRKFSRMITYTMSDFSQIHKKSRKKYNRFTLCYVLMSKIISMDIKTQPQDKTYRRSRARWNLFYQIHIISRCTRQVAQHQIWGTTTINHVNLSLITKSITPGQFFTLSQVNIRYIRNKICHFQHLSESSTYICVLFETWLKDSDEEKTLVSQIPTPSFNIISYPRKNGRGGRMAIIHWEACFLVGKFVYLFHVDYSGLWGNYFCLVEVLSQYSTH